LTGGTAPARIKNIVNDRKRFVKKMRKDRSIEMKTRVKALNVEIKKFFTEKKNAQIRSTILPGNT
jgi:hypothetical protein